MPSVPNKFSYDAVVVGSGPNGLAAAIRLAQENLSVLVVEGAETIGGGTRSAALTLPGYTHDVCSAVHPLGLGSPFFKTLPLEKYGLHWIHPEFPLAHPLADGSAAILKRDLNATGEGLVSDEAAYQKLFGRFVRNSEALLEEILRPMLHCPGHPVLMAGFGLSAVRSACGLARSRFSSEPARALFGGLAAHSFLPLEQKASASFGLVLGLLGHAVGWPLAQGGSQRIAHALAAHLRALGGEIKTHFQVEYLHQLPPARATLLDITPVQFLLMAEDRLASSYCERLKKYRYGPGVFKLDYALSQPIPWKNPHCGRAGTVHVGGTLEEVARSEREISAGRIAERPFVLLAQPTLFDASRAPSGKHIAWAYCHVPNGSTADMTGRVEGQIERFAPGFRDCVLARHGMNCAQMEQRNPNLVGGDINGGLADLWQLIARPVFSRNPYRTSIPGVYLCSSSTPPGGGVHGMCGFHAAEAALRDCFD